MKKQGFTLAELLITLGVIGVAAALLVPNLGKVLPDRNKITVLNTAKVINEITANLMNNDGLYYNINRCVGLACNATPKTAPYIDNKYSGDSKYSRLLISNLNVDGDVNEEANASAFKFKTTDGVFWTVTPTAITGGATIMIDVNGESKGKNCSFNTTSCKKPDQYVFVVDQMGKLHPGDPLTAAYTMNQTKTKNKKNDYTLAANFSDKTKDWQDLDLVVGRDRTDEGDDPCINLSGQALICCKNPNATGCGDDPCKGLSERECYCKKNVGKCEDPCKSNPTLPECKDPCAGKTGQALTCCKNKDAAECRQEPDCTGDNCGESCDNLSDPTDRFCCRNPKHKLCLCYIDPYQLSCRTKQEDPCEQRVNPLPANCQGCRQWEDVDRTGCQPKSVNFGGITYDAPIYYNPCYDTSVKGITCFYASDEKVWYRDTEYKPDKEKDTCEVIVGNKYCKRNVPDSEEKPTFSTQTHLGR